MTSWRGTLRSSIGTKAIMAVTGTLLFVFVIVHMLGNLQIFLGPDAINHYGVLLRTLPEALWAARIVLLVAVVVHVWVAILLTIENRRARPERYAVSRAVQVGVAPRTLIWTGSIIAAFVVYHLLHFTFGQTDPSHSHLLDARGRHDVYSMVVFGFSQWPVSLAYAVAQGLLALHLSHGASSLFQSLGLAHPRWRPLLDRTGVALAWIILIGNLSIPAAVMIGLLRIPGGP
jgi:succinate dehydrogenase / fumarate reductase cytochrome b subunit